MKVLLVDVNYKNSSTGKIVYDLSAQLKKNGHQAKVLFGRGVKIKTDTAECIAPLWEVYFHALMTRLTGLVGFFSYFATRRLISEIKSFQPDVVHLHELHGYYVNIKPVVDYLKKANISVVWTFHCEFMYTGKCGHAYDCEQWKTQCVKCPQLKEYPASMAFDFTNYMFNQKKNHMANFNKLEIVTPSKWLAQRVQSSFLNKKSLSVIHNGIDTTHIFYPRDTQHLMEKHGLHGKKIILAVAPDIMAERKGGEWVLKLAKQFDDSYRFIMIGLVGELPNPPNNVIPIKRTENQVQLAEYYSLADIFLICSRRENFPTTCLEALSCGTPILGFDEGGTAETAPTPYGRFVPYGDLTALKTHIDGFYNKSIEFKSEYECRDYAVKYYSKESMYANYLKLFTDMSKRIC
ncbi:glycosyltransferase [Stutzerimonas nitrititolerans]|uniref:glycosyltransferase n=1 Tax=Stutzerimonas nitrititolerans TaxID=2482751 RepID=UPI0028A9FA42|nr:glycosyltransferase [Stutzerimonas nitrititolerans]